MKKNNMNKKYNILLTLIFAFSISVSAQSPDTTVHQNGSFVIDQVIAIVGNKAIKQSDIENEYTQLKAENFQTTGDLKCMVFEKMLQTKLMVNQALLDSIVISESQLESELNQRLEQFISQAGSVEKLEKHFDKSLAEIKKDLLESLRDQQLSNKMQSNIIGTIDITPTEVKNFYKKIPKDSLPTINAQIEIGQIAAYPPFTEKAVAEVKDKLLDLRKRIVSGERFASLAVLYSEDPGSAGRGGEIGLSKKSALDAQYAKVAFALSSPGEVSRIVESEFGYHIIQLIERKGDMVNTRHILMKPKADPESVTKIMHVLDSIAILIRKDSIAFEKAVLKFSMDIDTRLNRGLQVNQRTGDTRFEKDQLTGGDLYAIKKLKTGEVSDPFESHDQKGKVFYKIISIRTQHEAHTANMKDDNSMLQEMAKNAKRQSILDAWFTDKIKTTYIHIDDTFKGCEFRSKDWLKAGNQ